MTKAFAFESIDRKGMYCADGPEVDMDINGETNKIENALLVIRTTDLEPPNGDDLKGAYLFLERLEFFCYEDFRKNYKPVYVNLNKRQLEVVRERNEW